MRTSSKPLAWADRGRPWPIRRIAETAITAALALGPIVLVALWLTFQHKPGWYRPAILDHRGIQAAHGDAAAVADFVSDAIVAGEPFDVVLQDHQVNQWLTALPHQWPEARKALPPNVTQPAIAFEEGLIRFGAHFTRSGWQAIVSAAVSAELTDDGRAIRMTLGGARGGSLPVPRSILIDLLQPLVDAAHRDRADGRTDSDTLQDLLRRLRTADDLFEGVKIPNRAVWFNGRRPFRLDAIDITHGRLRLRIHPL